MRDASLHGRVAPKSRSINVEANLLSERLATQQRVRRFVRVRAAAAVGTVLFVALVLPPIQRFNHAAYLKYRAIKARDKDVAAQLDAVQQQQDNAKPAQQDQQAIEQAHAFGQEFVGQTILFLNQVDPRIYLTSLSVSAESNAITFTAEAEAQDYEAARGFVTSVGATNKDDRSGETNILDMSSDGSTWADGVHFHLEHKVSAVLK